MRFGGPIVSVDCSLPIATFFAINQWKAIKSESFLLSYIIGAAYNVAVGHHLLETVEISSVFVEINACVSNQGVW